MRPERAERLLKWLLFLLGGAALLAVVPMVMPTDWMEAVNDWLGLGPFPRTPLTEYLTRSLSALYALVGVLIVFLALDVRRYRAPIVLVCWLTVALGAFLTVLDFSIGMPASWSWGEGPPTIALGAVMVWLAKRSGRPGSG
jgi:hypothetical protein